MPELTDAQVADALDDLEISLLAPAPARPQPATAAQGDVTFIHRDPLPADVGGRLIPAAGVTIVRSRWVHRPRHRLTGPAGGVRWLTYPPKLRDGRLGLLIVPPHGRVTVTHLDQDDGHAPITLHGGDCGAVYEVRRQRRHRVTRAGAGPGLAWD